ncbi:ABC transporter ATP-binding protein [Sphingomicrobium arenosum]|uniref:ABC transporter ATP-binding protein n=1 Tax=Sphingomicrobium arenosum TaxID=2233861 RepID=UPI00223F65C7|nr:ATP-binding cassette domain-containing protein [Sphingomicrobium arenosum]
MDMAVTSAGLTKRFGRHVAVDGIDLSVPRGSIYGFLGSNGAGKSTTVRMILGLRRPSNGTIDLFGRPLHHRRRPLVGAMADSPGGAFYDHLTARDHLLLVSQALGLEAPVDALLDSVGLGEARSRRVGGFSTGMRQRLGLARALVGDPPLLILDEPLNGLDPEGIRDMRQLLRELAEGRTLIICSHLLSELQRVATHIGLMSKGRLIHQGPLAPLLYGAREVDLESRDDLPGALDAMGLTYRKIGSCLRTGLPDGLDAGDLNRALLSRGVSLSRLVPHQFDLEEFYHERIAAAA